MSEGAWNIVGGPWAHDMELGLPTMGPMEGAPRLQDVTNDHIDAQDTAGVGPEFHGYEATTCRRTAGWNGPLLSDPG